MVFSNIGIPKIVDIASPVPEGHLLLNIGAAVDFSHIHEMVNHCIIKMIDGQE